MKEAELQAQSIIATAGTEISRIDEEKKRWEDTHHFNDNEIKLDIGGQRFTTTLTTLTRFPDTMIGAMFSGSHKLKKYEAGAYFIDRDGIRFRHILNFLRDPESFQINLKGNNELKAEIMLYGLVDRFTQRLSNVKMVKTKS